MFKKNGTLRAYGIRYEKFGLKYTAYATKEIIISAGTIESPKLLMLSGIGPKEHLRSFGIPVLENLPVGQNLQDHISALVGPFTIDKPLSPIIERDLTFASIREFIQNGTGILTATSVMATACISSQIGKDQGTGDWPDLQLILVGLGVSRLTADQFAESMNVDQKKMREFLDPLGGRDGFLLYVSLARPASRGEILLQSADYRIDPLINPKYFEDKGMKDIKILLEGVKTAVNISENAPSFAKLGARLSSIPWPSCSHHPFRSDEYWECQIRHLSLTVWHYVGTAAMGEENSPNAVVSSELRVIGTENLRVIDASVMPDIVGINTNAPTIMIAERGSQFILDTYAKDLK